jgi:hypothetical protein
MSAFEMNNDSEFSKYSKSYGIEDYIRKSILIGKLNGKLTN